MHISQDQLASMICHALAQAPNEACGLLAGQGDRVKRVYCLENAEHSPTTYSLTADGLLLAAELESAGALVAVFHSHTHTPAYPSETDRRRAFWDVRHVLISLQDTKNPDVRVFRIAKKDPLDPDELGEVIEENLEIAADGTVES